MSLFDVIKYGNIDIDSANDLNRLPSEVVKKWRVRVVEHACQSAESTVHQDTSGTCQELIDMTRKFMRGEVDTNALCAAYDAVNTQYNAANYAARNAANSARLPVSASYYAANAASGVDLAPYHAAAAYNAAIKLHKEWLMEELLKHESEEFCD